jgi:hypothetical protein
VRWRGKAESFAGRGLFTPVVILLVLATGLMAQPRPVWAASEAEAVDRFRAGRFREAAAAFEQLRAENPASAHACNLGLCFAKLGDAAAAVPAIRGCLEMANLGVVTRADYQELLARLQARIAAGVPAPPPTGAGDPIAAGVRLVEVAPGTTLDPAVPPVVVGPPGLPVPPVPGSGAGVAGVGPPGVPPAPAPPVSASPELPSEPTSAPAAAPWSPPVYPDLVAPQATTERQPRVARPSSGMPAAAYVTGVIGVLGVGAGVGLLFHQRALEQEIAVVESSFAGPTMPEGAAVLTELRKDRDRAERASTISFVVGGAGLFAALIAAVTADPEPAPARKYGFLFGPRAAAVVGRF